MSGSLDYKDYYEARQLTKSTAFLRHLLNTKITNIIKTSLKPPASGVQLYDFIDDSWGGLVFEFETDLVVSFIPDESIGSVVVRIEKLPDGKIVNEEDNYLEPNLFLIKGDDERLSNTRIAKIVGSHISSFKIFKYARLDPVERANPHIFPYEHAVVFEFDNNTSLIYDMFCKVEFTDEVSEEYWKTITPLMDIN